MKERVGGSGSLSSAEYYYEIDSICRCLRRGEGLLTCTFGFNGPDVPHLEVVGRALRLYQMLLVVLRAVCKKFQQCVGSHMILICIVFESEARFWACGNT